MAIIEDLRNYYDNSVDNDHLIDMVATEAEHHGIRPAISAPFARQLLESLE